LVRGLMWYHWKTTMVQGGDVHVIPLAKAGEEIFESILAPVVARVINVLGKCTFRYTGAQVDTQPEQSAWVIEFYGGGQFGDSSDGKYHIGKWLGAFTGPKDSLFNEGVF